MTIDKAQLRALAELSATGEWYAAGDLRYHDDKTGETHGLHHDDSRFIEAANPAVVFTLLAEIARLEETPGMRAIMALRGDCADLMVERDRLRAELAGLRTGYDAQNNVIAGLKAENEALRYDCQVANSVARAEQDGARRYRWLCEAENDVALMFGGHAWEDMSSEYMDKAIDAAMAKESVNGDQ